MLTVPLTVAVHRIKKPSIYAGFDNLITDETQMFCPRMTLIFADPFQGDYVICVLLRSSAKSADVMFVSVFNLCFICGQIYFSGNSTDAVIPTASARSALSQRKRISNVLMSRLVRLTSRCVA